MEWSEIKKEYITTDTSYRKLADKYGVSANTIFRKAKAEGWTEQRVRFVDKTCTKTLNAISNAQASRAARIQSVADKLLGKVEKTIELIDDESLDTGAYRQIAATLKDIKDIQMIKSDADMREQEARIDKLRREAEKDEGDKDTTVKITIEGGTDDWQS